MKDRENILRNTNMAEWFGMDRGSFFERDILLLILDSVISSFVSATGKRHGCDATGERLEFE